MRQMATFKPDLEVADGFLNFITNDKATSFRTFDDQETGKVRPRNYYGTLDKYGSKLVADNQRGSGIFWVVNATDGGGQSDSNVTGVRALFVDLDGAPLDPIRKSEALPHVIVETSPDKYHAYWIVNPGMPVGDFSKYQKALAKKFDADEVVHNLSRVMRLPGFFHMKTEIPFMSRVLKYREMLPYNHESLAQTLGLNFIEDRQPRAVLPPSENDIIPVGQRDSTLYSLGCSCRNGGMSYEDILTHLLKKNTNCCAKPLPISQVDKIARQVSKKGSWLDQGHEPIKRSGAEDCFGGEETPKTETRTEPQGKVKKPTAEELCSFITSFEDLGKKDIAPLKWIVPDVLPQGLTLLAGAPKMGKSLLVQQISYSVALGAPALDRFPVVQGAVLHLALEDSEKRFRDRMDLQRKRIDKGDSYPKDGYFTNQWAPLPEAITYMRKWCDKTPNAKLIVVDTLAKLIDGTNQSNQNVYNQDYQTMGQFHRLALDASIGIVIVHHLRKADATDPMMQISGSVGLTGAADLVWVFSRKNRNAMIAKLQSMGKDLGDTVYDLSYDPEHISWICDDYTSADSESVTEFLLKDLFKRLDSNAEITVSQVAENINRSRQHCLKAIKKLTNDEFLVKKESYRGEITYRLNPEIF